MNLTIISPCKNEAKNLPVFLKKIDQACTKPNLNIEVILVNDHSTDMTSQVAKSLKQQYPYLVNTNCQETGPGAALITGFKLARFSTIVTLDSDLSHNPKMIPIFVAQFRSMGSDILVGSRFITGGRADLPRHRLFLSRFAALALRLLTGCRLHDATSGFRVQKKSVIKKLGLENLGFAIHLEIPLKAILDGYQVDEFPIVYAKRWQGKSKMSILKIGPSYLKVLFTPVLAHIRPWFQN